MFPPPPPPAPKGAATLLALPTAEAIDETIPTAAAA